MAEALVNLFEGLQLGNQCVTWVPIAGTYKPPINGENYDNIKILVSTPSRQSHAVVFLGEGNFTFSAAFAAHRGSWQGIVPTTLYEIVPTTLYEIVPTTLYEIVPTTLYEIVPTTLYEIVPTTLYSLARNIRSHLTVAQQNQEWKETLHTCRTNCAMAYENEMQQWKEHVYDPEHGIIAPTRYHLDATTMKSREEFKAYLGIAGDQAITLWFQCPWSPGYRGGQNEFLRDFVRFESFRNPVGQEMFLRDFIGSASRVHLAGEFLLLGICIDPAVKGKDTPPYMERYGELQSAAEPFYNCIGADRQFVGEMLARGYKHQMSRGGQLIYASQFATLLFQRKGLTPQQQQQQHLSQIFQQQQRQQHPSQNPQQQQRQQHLSQISQQQQRQQHP